MNLKTVNILLSRMLGKVYIYSYMYCSLDGRTITEKQAIYF